MAISYDQVKAQVTNVQCKTQAFINGQYVDASSGKTFATPNPATGKVLATIAACDEVDVNKAVKCARGAFESGVWSQQSPASRKQVLLKLADLMEQHQFTLAILETLDTGKPIKDSMTSDIPGAIDCLRWYAESIDKIYGQVAPTDDKTLAYITREPLGVVGAVTPWNFPIYLACNKIAPALLMGNSLIVKPAEQASLTTIYLAELASAAGIPDGVLNVLPGLGEVTGKAIGLHPDIDGVSFTGSTVVGKLFLNYSGNSNMKRVSLECGGKSPNIIFADCRDLDKAATLSIKKVFYNQGEVCCAPTRLLVQENIKDQLLEKMIEQAKNYHPNDPLHPDTVMGAIIDQIQTKRILTYIADGQESGAVLACGGKQVLQQSGGNFIEPTILAEVNNAMKVAQEEIFGPVLSVISFKDEADAIKIANDTSYGLAASLWTQDISKAHRVAKAIRAGVVSVNCISMGDLTTPFGGYKQSGIGRDSSLHALDSYSELKTTWVDLG